ncbi:4-alpha-glucanotransferase [cf. Phormidesmis sp. LEGE 11477]|uniref:4-alpha-glucanotransferase n=1 Tax=cf. Phormidesmis sp. LEGE 11477 TaxID=1828680 RepID=UPI00187F1516|nr:4-alpha-glucanotransferase [cf. Phormidesmis sp. LEGE 11477]MBE9061731.1 4-alpha-glucanotransferase [cf. Phormidesmis sp. LEGE 11477]
MSFPRASGILLHPTSLPGRFGIGDLGRHAYEFVDFLEATQQTLWQILPLGPTGHGNSPYMSYSAMAGNPMLISLDRVQEEGLLHTDELMPSQFFPIDRVDYDQVSAFKLSLLWKAAERFKQAASEETKAAFSRFRVEQASWLDDYALFMALKGSNGGVPWSEWNDAVAGRDADALNRARVDLATDIFFHEYMQFEFYRQWCAIKTYANQRGIQIVGDMPIYVAHDSADVWAYPQKFMIDPETRQPSQMAGVPPDYFSETGQLWGNPTYNWEVMQADGFDWWMRRIQSLLGFVDLIRIDHFRGFEAFWAVPEGQDTAMHGEWVKAPGIEFFEKVEADLGQLPFLAEDLGLIDEAVEALRDRFDFPGMKILQFAFGSDHLNPYLPYNVSQNSLIYTGTHDNDTTVGWYEKAGDFEKQRIATYLGAFDPISVHWGIIRLAMSSVANQAIVPMQDILGLGSQARMNTPGVGEGNWGWRYSEAMLTPTLKTYLKDLTELYGRARDQPSA